MFECYSNEPLQRTIVLCPTAFRIIAGVSETVTLTETHHAVVVLLLFHHTYYDDDNSAFVHSSV